MWQSWVAVAVGAVALLAAVRGEVRRSQELLVARFDARFDRVDSRFDRVDSRFDRVDSRFDSVDSRFDSVDSRFDGLDRRLDRVDRRLDQVDDRIDRLEDGLRSDLRRLDGKIDAVRGELIAFLRPPAS